MKSRLNIEARPMNLPTRAQSNRLLGNVVACALGLALALPSAHAQTWPDRPIKLIVPAPTGGGMDGLGRTLAEALPPLLKQPVVVENRAGANSVVGLAAVARAAPDGYTLLLTASFQTIHNWTIKNLPYDGVRDFAGVAPLGYTPLVLTSSAQSGLKSAAEFRAFVERNRTGVPFAASAMETRLGAEMLLQLLKAKSQIISYKGTGPAMTDIAGGHVPLFMTTFTSVLPFKDTGKIHLIGIAAKQRSSFLPDVPTLAEQGMPVEAGVWYGVTAPAGTPAPIIQRLNTEIAKAAQTPEYQAKLKTLWVDAMSSTPAEFDAFIRAESERWRKVVAEAGIQPE